MGAVQTKQSVAVFVDFDRVVLRVHKLDIHFPYVTGYKIAQAIRVSGKHIQNWYNVVEDWNELADEDNIESRDYSSVPANRQSHRAKKWSVEIEGENVILVFDDRRLEMHFSDAHKIAQWFRIAGRKCQRNVGDPNKYRSGLGILRDAEENYKRGLS
jgi:hypothetical protein